MVYNQAQMNPETLHPSPTDSLIEKIKATLDEEMAQIEIATLRQLRNGILSLEAYYLMMLKVEGKRSIKTLSAQGALLGRVRAFAARLERIGLNPAGYTTATQIIALFSREA